MGPGKGDTMVWCQVTQHLRVFRGLTSCQRDSRDRGVTFTIIELPIGVKSIGCKWVFKTKKDSLGNFERHKVRLVTKGFT